MANGFASARASDHFFDPSALAQQLLRRAITAATRMPEPDAVANILAGARLDQARALLGKAVDRMDQAAPQTATALPPG